MKQNLPPTSINHTANFIKNYKMCDYFHNIFIWINDYEPEFSWVWINRICYLAPNQTIFAALAIAEENILL
jgi:hypothetical protein